MKDGNKILIAIIILLLGLILLITLPKGNKNNDTNIVEKQPSLTFGNEKKGYNYVENAGKIFNYDEDLSYAFYLKLNEQVDKYLQSQKMTGRIVTVDSFNTDASCDVFSCSVSGDDRVLKIAFDKENMSFGIELQK